MVAAGKSAAQMPPSKTQKPQPKPGFLFADRAKVTIGVAGFEPTTSASRTQRATKLRYTPKISQL